MRARPRAIALRDNAGLVWPWRELQAAVRDAKSLLKDYGVKPGDRVMLIAENCGAAVAFLFACSHVGAVVIPFNARATKDEVARVAEHATPAVVVITSAVSADAAEHAAQFGAMFRSGAYGDIAIVKGRSNPMDNKDVAVILYTTGTTGAPKGVMLTHANMIFGGRTSAELRDITSADVVYGALPISHVFGLASVVTASIYAGAEIRLEARFSAQSLLAALSTGITVLPAVPQMHALLMQLVKEHGAVSPDAARLRYVSSGGAPLDPAWKRQAEAFYGLPLQNGYGMTETTAGICATSHTEPNDDISCGPPLPEVDVKIAENGEVLTEGPHVMAGYYRNPEATAEVLDEDGWLSTGDLGKMDEHGHLHILGRSKELIIHGGFNVYPPEVEAVLSDHPQVVQAAVIGHMVDGDEKVLAFCQVSKSDPPDERDLRAFASARLAGYKRPVTYVFAESLPAAPSGKILKHRLKDVFDGRF